MKIKKIKILIALAVVIVLLLSSCRFWQFLVDNNNTSIGTETGSGIVQEEEVVIEEFEGLPDSSIVSTLKISGQAIDVDISGNYAYLTNDLGELYIINIKDKSDPRVIGKYPEVDSANIIITRGDYAYISYTEWVSEEGDVFTECGFKVIDISDKENPVTVGDYQTGENNKKLVFGMYIEDEYAYINTTVYLEGSELSTLEIIDIQDKTNPVMTGSITLEGSPSSVWVLDNYAYININFYDQDEEDYTGRSKLLVIDIEDKRNPVLVGQCEIPSNSWGIYVSGDYGYTSSNVSGEEDGDYTDSLVQVIDLSDKLKPVLLGASIVPGGAWELERISDYIYVSSLEGGIFAIDTSNPDSPVIADRLFTGGTSYDITIEGNYGYIADGFGGLVIAKLSERDSSGENMIIESDPSGNMPPTASIGVFGDQFSDYYSTHNPVYFSAAGSYDPEGSDISFEWEIEDKKYSSEENIRYYFEKPGRYEVKLTVSDGESSDETTEIISIADINTSIISRKQHDITIEIEYVLTNYGPGALYDIECFMRTPQTYYPLQIINGIRPSIPETGEIFDGKWNLLTHFEFEEGLEEGESLSAKIEVDISLSEFDYIWNYEDNYTYPENDSDLIEYTRDDLFIDSGSPEIEDAARALIGDETNTFKIARILYNFVIDRLYYDWDRAEDRNYPLMYATEILEKGSGVCADYAILYTALLRSVGIPARLAAGIPVYVILYEEGQEIDVGHAWVEVKLPGSGWVPFDITNEPGFMDGNYFMNIVTEKGPGYLYEDTTMDWNSYYYDGFAFSWDGDIRPDTEQDFIFRVKELSFADIILD